jgi:hypothetical protein
LFIPPAPIPERLRARKSQIGLRANPHNMSPIAKMVSPLIRIAFLPNISLNFERVIFYLKMNYSVLPYLRRLATHKVAI